MIALIERDHREDLADDHSGARLYVVRSRSPFICITTPDAALSEERLQLVSNPRYDSFSPEILEWVVKH